MIKVHSDGILQTRNQRFHSKRPQVHAAQFVPVAEDDVRNSGMIALASESVLCQTVAGQAGALVLKLVRDAEL